jgi:hypothetical protein
MAIRLPELTPNQISNWIENTAQTHAGADHFEPQQSSALDEAASQILFDFSNIRRGLNRARAKTFVDLPRPLRRLRTNQGAVNQSLIDALGGTVTVVELLVAEMRGLRAEVARLRAEARTREAMRPAVNGTSPGATR